MTSKNGDLECRRNRRRIAMQRQLRARAMHAATLFGDLRGERNVKMERQEKNKQQSRQADRSTNAQTGFHP
jgi:hypothetical protein